MEIIEHTDYLIYEDGRVCSKDRTIVRSDGRVRRFQGKFLKGFVNRNGYLSYDIYTNKQRIHFTAHRLIGLHYIQNPDNLPCINHINGIRSDIRIENLEWCTLAYNNQSVNKHSKHKRRFGNIQATTHNTFRARYESYGVGVNKNFPTHEEAERFLVEAEKQLREAKL